MLNRLEHSAGNPCDRGVASPAASGWVAPVDGGGFFGGFVLAELAQGGGLVFPPGIVISGEPSCYGRPSERNLRHKLARGDAEGDACCRRASARRAGGQRGEHQPTGRSRPCSRRVADLGSAGIDG